MESKVFNIDCLEYMKTLPDKYFDLCIADPPYGIGECGQKNHSRSKLAKSKIYTPKNWDFQTLQKDFFDEIENCFDGKESIFDSIEKDDLIIAFFPCIYFETIQQLCFSLEKYDQRNKSVNERVLYAIDRLDKRTYFHKVLYKLLSVVMTKGLRLIIENPATEPNYLISGQNFPQPTFIDKNRLLRGDYFKKPTAYWFFNCEPTNGKSYQFDKKPKRIDRTKASPTAGICSEERSMISPDYARNFICDFILGKEQANSELTLF